MTDNMKTGLIIAGSVLAIVLLLVIFIPISYNNTAAKAENLVIQAKNSCATTYDNGIKAVIEMAQVDRNTKDYLVDLIESATPEQRVEINEAYTQFVNGNTQPFMLLLGTMSNTNLTVTAENVQREISSQRSAMRTCSQMLISTQTELRNTLGMDASGRVKQWPQTILNLDYPSIQSDPLLRDNDGDGFLTVFDYRPPVDIRVSESFGTGEGIPPTDIYGSP